jgi:hydroxymethylpyrimidine pyrophosphatase-like HAD family hydrolase
MFPKLFVTDLDGTALGGGYKPYARFPDHFSEFLDYLHDNGCQWAINTTWDVGGQWDLVELSSVKSKPVFFMAEFGLRLATYTDKGPELVQSYVDNMEKQLLEVQQSAVYPLINDICTKFKPETMHFYGHLFSFNVITEEREEFNTYIKGQYSDNENSELTISAHDGRVGVSPKFTHKGLALAEAIKMLAITPEDVVIAGDETADVPMMQPSLAKFAVCPENSAESVKNHVTKINGKVGTGHSSHGVIDAFEKLFAVEI